jgi:hypothetical protein
MARARLYPVTEALRDRIAELVEESGIRGYRALSHRSGREVSYETVRNILTGQRTYVRQATLAALADTLSVSLDEFIALSLGAGDTMPWRPCSEFDELPIEMRHGIERALLALFRAAGIVR